MALATLPVGIFAYWAALHGDWLQGLTPTNLSWFVVGILGSIVLYALGTWLLGLEELSRFVRMARRR